MNKWVYIFSKEKTDGDSNMSNLLGGKGANLAEMSKLGLPVPPGFQSLQKYATNSMQMKKNTQKILKAKYLMQ